MLYFFKRNSHTGFKTNKTPYTPFSTYLARNDSVVTPYSNIFSFKTKRIKQSLGIFHSVLIRWLESVVRSPVSLYLIRFNRKTFNMSLVNSYSSLYSQSLLSVLKFRFKQAFFFLNKKLKRNLLPVFLFSLNSNDFEPFLYWILLNVRRLPLKRHRFFYTKVLASLEIFFKYFSKTFKWSGWYLRFAGKISITGNQRKRWFFNYKGPNSTTNLNLKAFSDTILVRTTTGCSNIFLLFFFLVFYMLNKSVIFFLKREKLTHKLTYSKTVKGEPMVAFLGTAVGAFVSYMSLNVLCYSGPNLDELSILSSYIIIVVLSLKSSVSFFRFSKRYTLFKLITTQVKLFFKLFKYK